MDKPLSQERLSEEILGMIEYDLEEGHQISWGHAHLMFTEVKRLQAIEASITKGKTAVKDIYDYWEDHDGPAIYSGQTIASIIYDVVNHLHIKIEGVNDHE